MSPVIVNGSAFAEIMTQQDWADIDTIYMACKEANLFGADFYERAIERATKAEIRRLLRGGHVKDADGKVVKFANIIIKDKEGRRQRVYKQELLFDVGDSVQVSFYWKGRLRKCRQRLDYYNNLAVHLHGPEIQGMLALAD